MAFASVSEILELRTSIEKSGFTLDFIVDVRSNAGRENTFTCDDIDHALEFSAHWAKHSDYVEIFRILKNGERNPTIGATCGQRINH